MSRNPKLALCGIQLLDTLTLDWLASAKYSGRAPGGQEPIACPYKPASRPKPGEGDGRGTGGAQVPLDPFSQPLPGVVEGPLRLGPGLGIQSPFFALSLWSLLCPCGARCPVRRAQSPWAEPFGRSPAVSAPFLYAAVVLVFSDMSGFMLEVGCSLLSLI
jgi:hypothetical protein